MPELRPGPADRELQRLIGIFLKAETDIINEIGRLRSMGLADYHVEAALERVQAILRRLESDCWTYVPRMIESRFYVRHPEARRELEEPETPEKHLAAYRNARTLTGEQMDIVQRLTMNLMGQIVEADMTVMSGLTAQLIGRIEPDLFRQTGLAQTAAMQAMGRGVYKALPDMLAALRREGVTAFIDKAGRRWSLHTYGSMVLRTTSRQAEVLSVLTQDPDHDLYKISKHGTTCKLCAPLEGRVYSRSGTDPDFPPLAAAFGKMDKDGPATLENSWLNIHPNCLHQLIRWTPMGRSEKELQAIKDFSSFEKNPVTRDPRTKKQIEAYRKKEEARRRWLEDYRQWERYRETVGAPVPKRFETFRKHKLAGDEKYKAWKAAYREANQVAKAAKSGIMVPSGQNGAVAVREIAKLDISKYQCISDGIRAENVILTDNQMEHIIKRRGMEFWEKYQGRFKEIVEDPDYIFADKQHEHTAIACKSFVVDGKTIQLVIRLALTGDDPKLQNSIITAILESNKRFAQRLRNNLPLYKKE